MSNGDWQRDRKGLHLSGPDKARVKAEDLADTIAATGRFDAPSVVVTDDRGEVVLQVAMRTASLR